MNKEQPFAGYVFERQRWVVHVLFWLVVLAFYVVFFGRRNSNYIQTFFFVGLLMPVTIATTYFLNYYLIPRYLMRERYRLFLLYFLYTLVASLYFEMMIAMLTLIVMAELNIREMSPASFDMFFMLTSLLMVVFFAMGIKMMLHWRTTERDHQRLMSDKIAAELKFLKGQLNPHFLFNTLNNLYYLSTQKSDKTPKAILQLSEILDYVMNSGKTVFVPLERELREAENYIALEMLRYEGRVKTEFIVDGETTAHVIGPMILITLIENAFKHGVMQSTQASWIKIYVACDEKGVVISICNSVGNILPGKGIGLENLRSQLNYLYEGRHSIAIEDKGESFGINLVLRK